MKSIREEVYVQTWIKPSLRMRDLVAYKLNKKVRSLILVRRGIVASLQKELNETA